MNRYQPTEVHRTLHTVPHTVPRTPPRPTPHPTTPTRDVAEPTDEVVADVDCAPSPKLLLTVEDAAQRLSLGRGKVYDLVLRGTIRSVKIGRARRIPLRELEAYVASISA